jgi:hypothetical protein
MRETRVGNRGLTGSTWLYSPGKEGPLETTHNGGEVIGRATQAIPTGRHAHVHNIESLRGRGDLAAGEAAHGV